MLSNHWSIHVGEICNRTIGYSSGGNNENLHFEPILTGFGPTPEVLIFEELSRNLPGNPRGS
jgi:hypothetical protein